MANPADPFLIAEVDILSVLSTTRSLLESYIRIRRTASTHATPELLSARADLTSALEDLTTDLQDLVDSVRAVEGDPYRYGLDVTEVERRRQLVAGVGREIESMRSEVSKTAEMGRGHSVAGLPNPDKFEDEEDGDGYAAFEEQRQQELLQEQDEQLESVFRTVGNLRMQADEMGRELEEQGELLDSVDHLADRVGGKLQEGLKKVGWVIKKNEGEQAISHNRSHLGGRHLLTSHCRDCEQLLHCHTHHGAYHSARASPHLMRKQPI